MTTKTKKSSVAIRDFTRDNLKLKVSFSIWDGKLGSERVAELAAKAEHAEQDRIDGKIIAIPRSKQKKTYSIKGAMTKVWHNATRPWDDGGWRLIPASEYAKVKAELEEMQRQYRDAVKEEIIKCYPELKAEAEKELNGLLGDRFPSKEVLIGKYDVRLYTDTVASASDIRFTGMSESEVNAIIAERERGMEEMIAQGNREMIRDVAKAAQTLFDTLSDPESGFHGNAEKGFPLINNVNAMLDRCEKFNITNDKGVSDLIARTRKLLAGIDLSNAKEDKGARKEAVKQTKTVLDELAAF